MRSASRDSGGQVLKVVSILFLVMFLMTVLAVFFSPLYIRHLPLVPLGVAVKAKRNAPLVRVGMTEAQVWSTLGLAGRGFRAHTEGSGPPEAYPANYVLWPGYVLHMRWNLKTHPATVVEFRFQDRL